MVHQMMNWPRPINIATSGPWCVPASRCNFSVRVYLADKLLSESGEKALQHVRLTPFLGKKTILVPPTYASYYTAYAKYDKLAESHVGSSIVDDSYKVVRSICIPITGSIVIIDIAYQGLC